MRPNALTFYRLSAVCQSVVEIRWENRAATVGFVVVDSEKVVAGAGFETERSVFGN